MKLYETLLTREEMAKSVDMGEYAFQQIIETSIMKDLLMMARDLALIVSITHNTYQLTEAELVEKLLNVHEIKPIYRSLELNKCEF